MQIAFNVHIVHVRTDMHEIQRAFNVHNMRYK